MTTLLELLTALLEYFDLGDWWGISLFGRAQTHLGPPLHTPLPIYLCIWSLPAYTHVHNLHSVGAARIFTHTCAFLKTFISCFVIVIVIKLYSDQH